jgi:hypothetical protein
MNQLKRSFNMATKNIADKIADCFPCDYQSDAMSEIIEVESMLAGAKLLFEKNDSLNLGEGLWRANCLVMMALEQLEFTRAKIDYGIVYEMQKSKADSPSLQ